MTTIDRTAYPQFWQGYSKDELQTEFALSTSDAQFVAESARGATGRLTLAVMLVCRRRRVLVPSSTTLRELGCRPTKVRKVPQEFVEPFELSGFLQIC